MNRHRSWVCAAVLAAFACFSAGTSFAQYTVTTLTTSGANADGVGVAVDMQGNLYLTGTYASSSTPGSFNGVFEVPSGSSQALAVVGKDGPFGYQGCTPGTAASQVQIATQGGIAVDGHGTMLVAQAHNNPMLKVSGGTTSCLFNWEYLNATGIAVDNNLDVYFSGNTYLSSQQNLVFGDSYSDPQATAIATPGCGATIVPALWGVAVDGLGNTYIADQSCSVIWKVTRSGPNMVSATPVAGTPGQAGFKDNVPATSALLDQPKGIAVDPDGTTLYIADTGNQRIRKVSGGNISTIAGNGTAGDLDGQGTSATLDTPSSLALGPGGAIYVGEGSPVSGTGGRRIRELTFSAIQIQPPPGSILPGSDVTFRWTGGPAGAQYQLDVSDKINNLGGGDLLGNASGGNTTTGGSLPVSKIPCDGRPIYVQLAVNGLDGWYTYTAGTCKMLQLSASPRRLPLQGGTLTLTAALEYFAPGTEVVYLQTNGKIVICHASTCTTSIVTIPTRMVTLQGWTPTNVADFKKTVPAIPSSVHATADFQAFVRKGTPTGPILDTATASASQN